MSKSNTSTGKQFKQVTKSGGFKIRALHQGYRKKQKDTYLCDSCGKKNLKRISTGIWGCNTCKSQYTGGAYEPITK